VYQTSNKAITIKPAKKAQGAETKICNVRGYPRWLEWGRAGFPQWHQNFLSANRIFPYKTNIVHYLHMR